MITAAFLRGQHFLRNPSNRAPQNLRDGLVRVHYQTHGEANNHPTKQLIYTLMIVLEYVGHTG